MRRTRDERRGLMADILLGGVIGGVVGAVVAVNVVIYAGIEPGYEATIAEVFGQNTLVGIIAVVALALGPLLGVVVARRLRRKRARSDTS